MKPFLCCLHKHKVFWGTIYIAVHDLVQSLGFYTIFDGKLIPLY